MGEAVEPGQALFTLADLSTMWLSLAVAADDAHLLETGLPVRAVLRGAREIDAELIWVSTSVDERTLQKSVIGGAEVPTSGADFVQVVKFIA